MRSNLSELISKARASDHPVKFTDLETRKEVNIFEKVKLSHQNLMWSKNNLVYIFHGIFRRSDNKQVMELELLGSIFSRLGEASGRGGEKIFTDYLILNTSLILLKYFINTSLILLNYFFNTSSILL